jgi:serine/threonine protein kinase
LVDDNGTAGKPGEGSHRRGEPTVRLDRVIIQGDPTLPPAFGRYRVLERIGVGGFASVYAAVDPELESPVAVKVLAENHSADPEIRRRFVAEARVARRLASDRLINVFDLGETDDHRPYMVMELADRGTLGQRLQHLGRPSTDDLLRLIEELGACMDAIHRKGVVHRDIKPNNLLLRSLHGGSGASPSRLVADDEQLVLADFGLARDISAGASALTVGGGTAGYMAPEQADPSGKADHRADLFAATVVLAEVTTLRHPERLDLATAPLSPQVRKALQQGMAIDRDGRPAAADRWRDLMLSAYRGGSPTVVVGSGSGSAPVPGPGARPGSSGPTLVGPIARHDDPELFTPIPGERPPGEFLPVAPQALVAPPLGSDGKPPPPPPSIPAPPGFHHPAPDPDLRSPTDPDATIAAPDPIPGTNPIPGTDPGGIGTSRLVDPDLTAAVPEQGQEPLGAIDQPDTTVTVISQVPEPEPTRVIGPDPGTTIGAPEPGPAAGATRSPPSAPPPEQAPADREDASPTAVLPPWGDGSATAIYPPALRPDRPTTSRSATPPVDQARADRSRPRPVDRVSPPPPAARRRGSGAPPFSAIPARRPPPIGATPPPPPAQAPASLVRAAPPASAAPIPVVPPPATPVVEPARPAQVQPPSRRQVRQAEKQARQEDKRRRKQERRERRRRRRRRLANLVIGLLRGLLAAGLTLVIGALALANQAGTSPDQLAQSDRASLSGAAAIAFFLGILIFPFPRYLRRR